MRSKVEVIHCDYCSSEHEIDGNKAISASAPISSQRDGAGGSETVFLQFDICPAAAEVLLRLLIEKHNMAEWFLENVPRARKA